MATVGRGAEQYTVRFPDGLRDRIKAAAEANNRSMNAEIVATLEEKYPAPKRPSELLWRLVEEIRAYEKEHDTSFRDAIGPELADHLSDELRKVMAEAEAKIAELQNEARDPSSAEDD